ncbi:hypothetical protein RND81_04G131900 [Saponaria officinalis]|uniref:Non-specific lipid-transfer protein n=1 Tax=Saponaria officinalis TaxID=3572 RepID=A0AAW1LE88_SAPOF
MGQSSQVKFFWVILVCMVLVDSPRAHAVITCGTVTKNIAQCVTYLMGTSTSPSKACCTGVTTLKKLAITPEDQKTACGCLKSAASSLTGLDSKRAAQLPKECDVSISYAIGPHTDCSKVS